MINHVADSVYYLLGYEYNNDGIHAENILIDKKERYLPIDRELFMPDN
jgi:hypothetical protein